MARSFFLFGVTSGGRVPLASAPLSGTASHPGDNANPPSRSCFPVGSNCQLPAPALGGPGGRAQPSRLLLHTRWDVRTRLPWGGGEASKRLIFPLKRSICTEYLSASARSTSGFLFQLNSNCLECQAAQVLHISPVSFVYNLEQFPVSGVNERAGHRAPE